MSALSNNVRLVTADEHAIWVRTDDLARHPKSQIRAEPDTHLIAEYAEAMLEGATFPPVVIYRDAAGHKYLADGHHRVDAAALAALRDKTRPAEVLAEIREGTFDDALRHAMQANHLHGKRLTEGDYARAIRPAFEHNLIVAVHAKDVVPEIVDLIGCSIPTAQENSVAQRREMMAKRDRHIWSMHREGQTQEAIGAALEVPRKTVADVIARIGEKRDSAKTAKPKVREKGPPKAVPSLAKEKPGPGSEPGEGKDEDEAAEVTPEPEADTPEPEAEKPPSYRINVSPYLPLLDRLRPLVEGQEEESGAVGALPDVSEATEEITSDTAALIALRLIAETLLDTRRKLNKLGGLRRAFSRSAAVPALAEIELMTDFLSELGEYIEEGSLS